MKAVGSATLKTGQSVQIGGFVSEVRSSINVQNNCYDSRCQTVKSVQPFNQLISQNIAPDEHVLHNQTDLYILNSASLYNGQAHHKWAHIEPQTVVPKAWAHAIMRGLRRWKNKSLKKS
ncbi:hypothetical protein DFH28DRAFT_1079447 [Melampsora americana]|nr:hypothetical protein DFH28DRAFT_1079447 [Melampsora americana]